MSEFGGLCKKTKTPSLHRRLGSATLSQLAFPGEGNPNFQLGQYSCKSKKKNLKSKVKLDNDVGTWEKVVTDCTFWKLDIHYLPSGL